MSGGAEVAFVVLFAGVVPAAVYGAYPRVMHSLAEGEAGVRARVYRRVALGQWALALAGVLVWARSGRSFGALGLRAPSGAGAALAGAVALAVAAPLVRQLRAAQRDAAIRSELRARLGGRLVLAPRGPGELPAFVALAVTAGACQELLYRGWLIGVLAPAIGTPGAAAVSALLFGAAHACLGVAGAVRATGAGLLFAGLYGLSGSLALPAALHAFRDATRGRLSVVAFRDAAADETAA